MTILQCRGTLQGNAMFTMTMTIKENVEHLEIVDMMLQLVTVQYLPCKQYKGPSVSNKVGARDTCMFKNSRFEKSRSSQLFSV